MSKLAVIVLFVGFFAFGMALRVSRTTFDRLPHLEDEYAYTYQAQLFAHGDIYIPTPQPPRAFWQPFLIDLNGKRFGKYPPGWPLLLAAGYLMGIPHVINAWFAILNICLIYRMGREIFNRQTGILAAVLMASSPIAILQNSAFMPHPSALFFTMLAIYGLWRMELNQHLRWSLLAGLSLGMVVAIRPFVGLTVAIPLAIYSAGRLLHSLWPDQRSIGRQKWRIRLLLLWLPITIVTVIAFWASTQLPFYPNWPVLLIGLGMAVLALRYTLVATNQQRVNPVLSTPFRTLFTQVLVVGVAAVAVGALHPIFNTIVAGHPDENLYTYIWDYDTPGFGEDHGRPGRLITASSPPGTKIGLQEYDGHTWQKAKRHLREDLGCYSRDLFGWVPQPDLPPQFVTAENGCVTDKTGLSWVLLPVGLIAGWRRRWIYMLGAVAASIIIGTMWFWIGASLYSARYFYEAMGVIILISAYGLSVLFEIARRVRLEAVAVALLAVLVMQSVIGYVPRRLQPLENTFTARTRAQIALLQAHRQSVNQPVLIIVWGDVHWREFNAFMALTSPYLDSPIILARDPEKNKFLEIEALFPQYQVLYYKDGDLHEMPFD